MGLPGVRRCPLAPARRLRRDGRRLRRQRGRLRRLRRLARQHGRLRRPHRPLQRLLPATPSPATLSPATTAPSATPPPAGPATSSVAATKPKCYDGPGNDGGLCAACDGQTTFCKDGFTCAGDGPVRPLLHRRRLQRQRRLRQVLRRAAHRRRHLHNHQIQPRIHADIRAPFPGSATPEARLLAVEGEHPFERAPVASGPPSRPGRRSPLAAASCPASTPGPSPSAPGCRLAFPCSPAAHGQAPAGLGGAELVRRRAEPAKGRSDDWAALQPPPPPAAPRLGAVRLRSRR